MSTTQSQAPDTVEIYDVTLRDGVQGPRIKFSSEDQIRVVRELDAFGVRYIEGGQPGSNPKAAELFERTRDLELKHAKMAAFGSTRYSKALPEDDANLRALLTAGTEVVTIFAKSSVTHVRQVLNVSLEENLTIVDDSVAFLRSNGRRVFVDAEHFFDGYKEDSVYALTVLETAARAGAEVLILCDTNGGSLPWEIAAAIREVRKRVPGTDIGIHTHNDTGCAVANTLAAVTEGAMHVQGTINGYGERTGNANLCTIIPDLQLKMGIHVVTPEQLGRLTHLSHLVAELANVSPKESAPFVGRDAFTHKGGMHADAVRKLKSSYEHINPELVGNLTSISVSEVSGRSSLLQKAQDFGVRLERDKPETHALLKQIKELENEGYEFEGADASLELLMRKATGEYKPFFTLMSFNVNVEYRNGGEGARSEATLKIKLVDGTVQHTVAEGEGPVDALNGALHKALDAAYPEIKEIHLEDYKVRILDSAASTRAKTRVLIESSDPETTWDTVGVSENIIEASYEALVDSFEYKIFRTRGF